MRSLLAPTPVFIPAILLVLFAPPLVRADGPATGAVMDGGAGPSIHERELRDWKRRETAGWRPWVDPQTTRAPRALGPRALTREVHGFHPYWMGSAYTSYDWSVISTVAFFSLELGATGAIVADHGWPWTTLVSTAHQNATRVIVTATLFDGPSIDALLSSPANRANAVSNLVGEVVAGAADGVNVDFEGVPGARKQDLVSFLGELQTALAAAVPSPYLTIATPAVDWNNAFDYDELAARCDHLLVMAYDYHWPGSATTGPVSPLAGWGTHNVTWTVNDYQTWGATPDKMLLGVPYYGYRWGAVSGDPGAATTSSGLARTYDQAKSEADTHGTLWDATSSTPWYRYQDPDWFQGWFDDAASLPAKYAFVESENLAGVGIWALGYDGSRPELWTALGAAFGSGTGAPAVAASGTGAGVRLVNAGANPFRERAAFRFETARPGAVRLGVYDATGRLVRTLSDSFRAAGEVAVASWDGRDAAGRPVAAGVYLVRLETAGHVSSLRVVRLR